MCREMEMLCHVMEMTVPEMSGSNRKCDKEAVCSCFEKLSFIIDVTEEIICKRCHCRCWTYWNHLFRREIILTFAWMEPQRLHHVNHLLHVLTL